MKFGLDVPTAGAFADPRLLADLAAEAELAGWDGFFIWDGLLGLEGRAEPNVDPWVTLAAIAMRTQHIRIGAFMTALPRRRPWKVARETVTLDHLSGGRLTFGVGLGFQPHDFVAFGEEANLKVRAEKLDEGLEIVTGLWKGEPFSFQGKHYQVQQVTLLPPPLQSPRIPIWTAGGWPRRKPFRRAARWDGVYLMTNNQATDQRLSPDEVKEIAAYVHAQRKRVELFDIAVNVETPSDPSKGAEIVRPYFEAGATWCVELAPDTPKDYRRRIQSGPPKV